MIENNPRWTTDELFFYISNFNLDLIVLILFYFEKLD